MKRHEYGHISKIFAMAGLFLSSWVFSVLAAAQRVECPPVHERALILSGGGARGAFEAGAIYHLVVQRHCDFKEISGVSVGALNAAFLAQAERSDNAEQSLNNLAAQAELLVRVWDSFKGPNDIFTKRRLGMLRFGLFKLEYLNDFTPLHDLIRNQVSATKLMAGRTVRIGVVSFWDGRYREVVASRHSESENKTFLDFVFASSLIPIYGQMPQIQDDPANLDPALWPQFADAGLRRVTPVSSYFKGCDAAPSAFNSRTGKSVSPSSPCIRQATALMPDHDAPLRQLFVVIASPYSRASDQYPLSDVTGCCDKGTHRYTDGHKIMERTINLAVGLPYRWDLDFAQTANEFLRWRQEFHTAILDAAGPGKAKEFQQKSDLLNGEFPLESYNTQDTSGLPSLPYEINIIVPRKVFADVYGFDPANIREQLYCGCSAADQVMSDRSSVPFISAQCAKRFPRLPDAKSAPRDWESDVCTAEHPH